MYSMALGLRFFKWKMLSLSGPKALLFLHLLIALLPRSLVNVCTISKDFLFFSLVTYRVSLEEVCLPSFDVLNCWLNLAASCLDDENELPLKVIATFSASRYALPSIPLMVLHSLVISVFWSKVSKKFSIFTFCVRRCGSGCHKLVSTGEVGTLLRSSSRLVITSNISVGTCSSWSLCRPVGKWCEAALSRTVRKIFSSLWSLLEWNACSGRPTLLDCICPSYPSSC